MKPLCSKRDKSNKARNKLENCNENQYSIFVVRIITRHQQWCGFTMTGNLASVIPRRAAAEFNFIRDKPSVIIHENHRSAYVASAKKPVFCNDTTNKICYAISKKALEYENFTLNFNKPPQTI